MMFFISRTCDFFSYPVSSPQIISPTEIQYILAQNPMGFFCGGNLRGVRAGVMINAKYGSCE